jgi:hypothetical protein
MALARRKNKARAASSLSKSGKIGPDDRFYGDRTIRRRF